jgi:outer membrane lipoprotein carrier protein
MPLANRPATLLLFLLFAVAFAGSSAFEPLPAYGQTSAPVATLAARASAAKCTALATAPSRDQAVACVQWVYDQSRSFQASFQQLFTVKAYATEKTSSGTVTFEKPGKMLWRYDRPQNNRVVSDGTLMKVYEASNQQMYEQPVEKSQYPAALSFLTGTGKLADSFDFDVVPGDKVAFPGGYALVGTPKEPTPAYSKVLFYVDLGTSQVRRVMIIDGQGNRNRFDFVNPQFNVPIPPDTFRYVPPAGTTIVRP